MRSRDCNCDIDSEECNVEFSISTSNPTGAVIPLSNELPYQKNAFSYATIVRRVPQTASFDTILVVDILGNTASQPSSSDIKNA
jgi:hypothetical protein